MRSTKRIYQIAGWLVFAIAFVVYYLSAERTGSLWDCGEFILGAYKLQVVHPPGAPVFLLIGRMFTWVADMLSDNPEDIAFAINLLSGICSAFAAAFIAWVTIMFGRLSLVGRAGETSDSEDWALAGSGLVAGLATAFCTSIWFSAVEGEVYAMSTFFTTMTLWGMVKWYVLPDEPQTDRWLMFTIFSAGLSIGVHLLSLLTFPALALLYYFKKYQEATVKGTLLAAAAGAAFIVVVQKFIITGIPTLWSWMEMLMVNGLGLPFHTGLIPTLLIVGAILYFGLRYAHRQNSSIIQNLVLGLGLVVVAFSTMGMVVIRANAAPPINMNSPTDAMRLLPYLNREQYGERPLLYGPHFASTYRQDGISSTDRYGRKGDRYEVVDSKVDIDYPASEKMFFPRMSDNTQQRDRLYKQWMGLNPDQPLPRNRPNQVDNISFMLRYQIGWMWWRYFMWNFAGRQNGDQGYYDWDETAGNWISGIAPLDAMRLGNQNELPETVKNDPSRNTYYLLPFLFGLVGLFFHYSKRKNDFLALLALFIITGIGIIIYSNQPPNEPRERDYVLVGSFFTYCIWIGMAVLALYRLMIDRAKLSGVVSAVAATALVLIAPLLMGFENFDDHDRSEHYAARDYASNFLQSVDENAIIFTYGDNDTYPLWYAQEVEGIRTDVRVINLSLIAVDWYIDLLRRKVNDSPAIAMSIPQEQLRGKLRNQVLYNPNGGDRPTSLQDFMRYIGEDHPIQLQGGRTLEAQYLTTNVFLPVDRQKAIDNGILSPTDSNFVSRIPVRISDRQLLKDDIAVLDIIASNFGERPIYFAVTTQESKLFGMNDFMRLEGLALRLTATQGQSDPAYSYSMVGKGDVDSEKVYDNVMNKFRWGNFDKVDTYVNRSYSPSVQSTQLLIRRAALDLLDKGQKDKAMELTDQYFSAFPHMNFPYDYRTWFMISVYLEANDYERAKPHLETLAYEMADQMEYYMSLDDDILADYENDFRLTYQTMQSVMQEATRRQDNEFKTELDRLFGPYLNQLQTPQQNVPLPPGGN